MSTLFLKRKNTPGGGFPLTLTLPPFFRSLFSRNSLHPGASRPCHRSARLLIVRPRENAAPAPDQESCAPPRRPVPGRSAKMRPLHPAHPSHHATRNTQHPTPVSHCLSLLCLALGLTSTALATDLSSAGP